MLKKFIRPSPYPLIEVGRVHKSIKEIKTEILSKIYVWDLKSYSFGKKLKIMIVNDKWRKFFMLICTTCKKIFYKLFSPGFRR